MRLEFCASCGTRIGRVAPCACPACGARYWRNPKPCAGALVTRDDKVLLIRRAHDPWRGRWDIPGGFCDAGEHPEHTAVREVREEAGLEVAITGTLGMWMDTYDDADPPETTLNVYFLAETADARPASTSDEATEVGWFAPADVPDDLAFPAHAPLVIDAWRATRA